MNRFAFATGLAVALATALPATAATIDPTDFDLILTESNRTATIDGADISGNEALPGNSNISTFSIGLDAPVDVLLAGKVGNGGRDRWESRLVTGELTVDVLNFTTSRNNNTDPFSTTFDILVNGTVVQSHTLSGTNNDLLSASFSPIVLDGDNLQLRVQSVDGRTSYDIGVSLQPVPLAASFPLLLTAGGALVVARRRKARTS
jgi:hypothetical protein